MHFKHLQSHLFCSLSSLHEDFLVAAGREQPTLGSSVLRHSTPSTAFTLFLCALVFCNQFCLIPQKQFIVARCTAHFNPFSPKASSNQVFLGTVATKTKQDHCLLLCSWLRCCSLKASRGSWAPAPCWLHRSHTYISECHVFTNPGSCHSTGECYSSKDFQSIRY